MALDRTSGYDMLVQISEMELNDQIATAFLAGSLFGPSMSVSIDTGGVVGIADLNFNTPVADLDRPRPQMGLTIPFTNSQLQITAPLPGTLAPLGGSITIVDRIVMISQGSDQFAAMDFVNGAPTVSVVFDTASQAVLAPALAAGGLTLEQAQNLMAGAVLSQLQSDIGRFELTPAIPVVDDRDPTTIFDIDVTTVNDTSSADRDCLAFGVRMANDSGGNVNGITNSFIPSGSESLVMMSNFWLLARVLRPRMASSLGLQASDFNTPLRLNHNVPAPGGDGTLTRLEARVEGNRIRVDGRARDSGTGWSAVSNFSFFVDVSLTGGSLTVTATTPSVDTDVDLEWWVWLFSLGLGGWIGGIIGVIVAAIVLAIVEAVAEGFADNLISGGIGGALGGLPAIPLGPIGGGLTLTSVVLDDLEFRAHIMRSVSVPVKSHGAHSSETGFSVDLDTGTIGSNILSGTDLIWDPDQGLSTNSPCGLTITGSSFSALSPVQISRLPLSTQTVPVSLIPLSLPPFMPFISFDDVVFGVRTTEGRYAKVQAWRSILGGGALQLRWLTYATPTSQLEISSRWTVIERGEVHEYIRPDCSYCRSNPVRWCGAFEARPRLMAFPIDYQWCFCGTVLDEGVGEAASPHGPLAYKLKGRRLYLQSGMKQNIAGELCVSAIDTHGQELFTCIQLSKSGVETRCKKCTPRSSKVKVEVMAAEPVLRAWRPLLAGDTMQLDSQGPTRIMRTLG